MENLPKTDTLPTRMSLLDRLRNLDDAPSWKNFFERYEERIIRIARSRGLSDCDAEDVAQEVFKRVAQTICQYRTSPRPGSFRSWLYNLTRWRATDQLRQRARLPLDTWSRHGSSEDGMRDRTPTIERIAAPAENEAAFEAESRRHLIDTLLKQVEKTVSPKQLQVFQLLVLDEAAPAKVAEVYGISVASVYVIKHRVAAKLRDEMSRLNLPID